VTIAISIISRANLNSVGQIAPSDFIDDIVFYNAGCPRAKGEDGSVGFILDESVSDDLRGDDRISRVHAVLAGRDHLNKIFFDDDIPILADAIVQDAVRLRCAEMVVLNQHVFVIVRIDDDCCTHITRVIVGHFKVFPPASAKGNAIGVVGNSAVTNKPTDPASSLVEGGNSS